MKSVDKRINRLFRFFWACTVGNLYLLFPNTFVWSCPVVGSSCTFRALLLPHVRCMSFNEMIACTSGGRRHHRPQPPLIDSMRGLLRPATAPGRWRLGGCLRWVILEYRVTAAAYQRRHGVLHTAVAERTPDHSAPIAGYRPGFPRYPLGDHYSSSGSIGLAHDGSSRQWIPPSPGYRLRWSNLPSIISDGIPVGNA